MKTNQMNLAQNIQLGSDRTARAVSFHGVQLCKGLALPTDVDHTVGRRLIKCVDAPVRT